MEIAVRDRSRLILPAAIAVAVVFGLAFARPAGGAIPASSVVGKVTYVDIDGSTDLTTTIRSFTMKASQDLDAGGAASGAGSGKATFGLPRVVQDVVADSPSIMLELALGNHHPTIVVTLYRAGSTTRFQRWAFTEAVFTLDEQTQKGPSSAWPSETVSWTYETVRQSTYKSDGDTVLTTTCFDVAGNAEC